MYYLADECPAVVVCEPEPPPDRSRCRAARHPICVLSERRDDSGGAPGCGNCLHQHDRCTGYSGDRYSSSTCQDTFFGSYPLTTRAKPLTARTSRAEGKRSTHQSSQEYPNAL